MECYGCINPPVCYLKDEYTTAYNGEKEFKIPWAWCKECATCPNENCGNPFYCRVTWNVGYENNPVRLRKDVCEECSNYTPHEKDCHCSQTARNKKMTIYSWIEKSQ